MIVEVMQAKVYKGGRRRFFTKNAAYRAAARAKINSRCECCDGDLVTPGESCEYHVDMNRFQAIIDRLVYIYKRADDSILPQPNDKGEQE